MTMAMRNGQGGGGLQTAAITGMRPPGRVAGTDAAESRIPAPAADRLRRGFFAACACGRRMLSFSRSRAWGAAGPHPRPRVRNTT